MSSFVAYIDESGDEGFTFLDGERGSSRWLVLSAVVVRKSNDHHMIRVARETRELLRKPPKKALHFRELKHEHRVPFVRKIAEAPFRTVSVMIHKPSIESPENFASQKFQLYRYATRLLLERVSWLCRDAHKPTDGDGRVELVFSNRSAMSYDSLREYLHALFIQSANGADVRIDWNVIEPSLVRAVNHDQLAGLQIADAVASGMFFAVNRTQYGEVEPRYARDMAGLIYRHRESRDGYGVKTWCTADEKERFLASLKRSE